MYPCGILKDWKRNSSAHFGLLKVPIDFYLEKDLQVRSMIIRFRDYLHFGNLMYLNRDLTQQDGWKTQDGFLVVKYYIWSCRIKEVLPKIERFPSFLSLLVPSDY